MVRTKVNNATRAIAGSKIPKKCINNVQNGNLHSPTEKGKDNLPVNRYFPRETPSWQKKITFFYDKNISITQSTELVKSYKILKENISLKRSSSKLDEESDMETNENNSNFKKIKINSDVNKFFQQKNRLRDSSEINENESMKMEE